MFERILYPTDFSEVSLKALRECLPEIVRPGVKELHLLHVLDITTLDVEAFSLQEVYEEKLEKLKGDIKGMFPETEIVTYVSIGIPSLEIAEYASGKGIDLIVTPTTGENIWRRMFLGSTASNLARATKKPVLLLKYEKKEEEILPTFPSCSGIFSRPLVALDFSKCSIRIVKTVKKFEELIESGILLHSVDYGGIDELEHNIEIARKNLEKTAKGIKAEFELEVMVGTASQAIIGTALAKKATIIVIGKKGRSFLKDLILGSTAERVMRDSKIPVLLVPCD
ncbi:universal stress protein [Thermococcus gammatolerans]|uniref:Universal stress protein (UspA) n=1 Tax=Thermococcus gammatolerans (strain DSM 15229 / JCM 11827 / EJ3) TaxID=593117 RepID=C5A3N9_THEGJ|nr:universal stress protein [Thermococcus gammatolerans]ACS32851.1 Universal stress protein (UspA) [Thermococcus gammatolerans EJ3]